MNLALGLVDGLAERLHESFATASDTAGWTPLPALAKAREASRVAITTVRLHVKCFQAKLGRVY